jgi:type I restriction enzyme S subunit
LSYDGNSAEGKSTTFAFDESHVLYGKLRPYLNKVVAPERKGRCSTEIIPLLPQGVDREFLAFFLRTEVVVNAAMSEKTGSRMPRADMDVLLSLEVSIPETISAQRQIAARLKAQLSEVETARQAAQAQVQDAGLLCTKIVDATFNEFQEWQPIAAVAKVQSGYAFKSEDFRTSGVRLLRNTNILPGRVYWDDAVFLDESKAGRYSSYALEEGDVLISLDRPWISSGIKVARVGAADMPSLLLQRVGRFLLKPDAVDPDFLYAFLQSSRFIAAISGHDQSLGVPHISPGQIEAIELPLLPLDAQRQVAARLKAQLAEADALRAALDAQYHELDLLPSRILAAAFET